jgi:molybdate transport system substrate-binding protein
MKKIHFALFMLFLFTAEIYAQTVTIFAASSTKLPMQEIVKEFSSLHPNTKLKVNYSATGKAYAQFTNGFAYDIFIAADSTYTAKIYESANAIAKPQVYAYGAVALFSHNAELIKGFPASLQDAKVKHISIANPRLAPYGAAALEILENYGIKETLKNKLVLGDNIAQSVQFVDSGAAEVGFVAFSLIKSSKKESEYLLIDKSKYTPMQHSFVLTKYAKNKAIAQKFGAFLLQEFAQNSFVKHGFSKAK